MRWQRWNGYSHAANWRKRNIRLYMIGWERWCNGNDARDHAYKWYMHKKESVLIKEIPKIIRDGFLIPGQKVRPFIFKHKEKSCHPVDFTVPVDPRVKIKDQIEYLKKSWRSGETCCHLVFSKKKKEENKAKTKKKKKQKKKNNKN